MSEDPARARVLGRIRTALGVDGPDAERLARVEARLATPPRGPIPERARRPAPDRIALFAAMLEEQGAEVRRLAKAADIPAAIVDYLRAINLPARVRMGDDPVLAGLPWQSVSTLERLTGAAGPDDPAGLSRAAAAAAETGTLFLVSGPANPTTVNFVPDVHIAVIAAHDVLGSYEEAWDRVRSLAPSDRLPRSVNLISGPSRTADVEQTIIMGVHGPRRLHVLLIGET